MKRIGLIWRTIRHLTARQVAYQLLTRLRSRARPGCIRLPNAAPAGHWLAVPEADKSASWASGTFTLLNQSVNMAIPDWNYSHHGKLWTYTLNYFDFLNQPGLSAEMGLWLMRDFMAQTGHLKAGFEAYPTSLRIGNWVQFLSRNQIQDGVINRHLYAQTDWLRRRLEYHLAGNHLLENGFAFLTAALYFRQAVWFRRASTLVRAELSAQILADGGHDERSPVYHQMLLDRLLNALIAVTHDTWHNDPTLGSFLEGKASKMLGWLTAISFRNGDVPMMNDAAPGIAPTTAQLQTKGARVGLKPWSVRTQTTDAEDTGYRKFTLSRHELVADVGTVGPAHQPGHAHADTFSFVLYVDNQPLIVDSGTSTYEIGPRRAWERSTAAHNTVEVNRQNSSEIWAGFRVGRRARVTVLTDTPTTLTARHDGYRHLGISHERTWSADRAAIRITDRLLGRANANQDPSGVARLHFHPDVLVSQTGTGIVAGVVRITFASEGIFELRLGTYEMADGFNRLRSASCVDITFTNHVETLLTPTQ